MEKSIIKHKGQFIDILKEQKKILKGFSEYQKEQLSKFRSKDNKIRDNFIKKTDFQKVFNKSKEEIFYMDKVFRCYDSTKHNVLQQIIKTNINPYFTKITSKHRISGEQLSLYDNYLSLSKINIVDSNNNIHKMNYYEPLKKIDSIKSFNINIKSDLLLSKFKDIFDFINLDFLDFEVKFNHNTKNISLYGVLNEEKNQKENFYRYCKKNGFISSVKIKNLNVDLLTDNGKTLIEITNNESTPLSLEKIFSTIYYVNTYNYFNPKNKIKTAKIIYMSKLNSKHQDKIPNIFDKFKSFTNTTLVLEDFDYFYQKVISKYENSLSSHKLNLIKNKMILKKDTEGNFVKYEGEHEFIYDRDSSIFFVVVDWNFKNFSKVKKSDNENLNKKNKEIKIHSKRLLQ